MNQAKELFLSVPLRNLSSEEEKDLSIKLAASLLRWAQEIQTPKEKRQQATVASMIEHPEGKRFITALTDRCFRSTSATRTVAQLREIIAKQGIPPHFPLWQRASLFLFNHASKYAPGLFSLLLKTIIRRETAHVILPGEAAALAHHIEKREKEGVMVNLNRLGEAILGEKEAAQRLEIYLKDLSRPDVHCISVKISTIYSQIHLIDTEHTLEKLSHRLEQLYRAALYFQRTQNQRKFVYLDMEEYKDLHLTIKLFQRVLDREEFLSLSAGIVLQAYLPDSYHLLMALTEWSQKRVSKGGAPIQVRIVKGANLAMEQIEASHRGWPQAPYRSKREVDANFKRLLHYATEPERMRSVKIGVGSHNLFDVAYALVLCREKGVSGSVSFEMLEGMGDHMRRVVQALSGTMLLYCPAAKQEEFQHAVAYLVRRLDENTAPENFLRYLFSLEVGNPCWEEQRRFFVEGYDLRDQVSSKPRRTPMRVSPLSRAAPSPDFINEPDTDWSLPEHVIWIQENIERTRSLPQSVIPCVINGTPFFGNLQIGEDPSYPGIPLYQYSLAPWEQVDRALECSSDACEAWNQHSIDDKIAMFRNVAQQFREARGALITAMMADTGKTVYEADVEISEAIDFLEYYAIERAQWEHFEDLSWRGKGTVVVASPWNFPCSIPTGGIAAALLAGNTVIFKPAPEAILVGWQTVQLFWAGGVPQHVLQFIVCEDASVGSKLISDQRVAAVILTGATATANLFLQMRPGLDLIAETGGKNTLVITAMADRDLAIKHLIDSAFGHAGQKCSACSLAILDQELYNDPHFLDQLKDAAESLSVGSPWTLHNKINPLIRPPNPILHRGLTELEEGESWLLKPRVDAQNPGLWSPGIKLGVRPGSFCFDNELFGPVLGLVRAENLQDAFKMMNQTEYGLTAGIHTLDEKEQRAWLDQIEAGNCYINRTITGAIVNRQPFGGCKASCFGRGAKAGGPNYLLQLMTPAQVGIPVHRDPIAQHLLRNIEKIFSIGLFQEEQNAWIAGVESAQFFWNHWFSQKQDPNKILGQDNWLIYRAHRRMIVRESAGDAPLDLLFLAAIGSLCKASLEISLCSPEIHALFEKCQIGDWCRYVLESEDALIYRLSTEEGVRLRTTNVPGERVLVALFAAKGQLHRGPIVKNGRVELTHFFREVTVSYDYHRYGNLGEREGEAHAPIL